MSYLVLVRHGQASFLAENYDQLSAKGRAQSEHLGEYWSAVRPRAFDLVIHGPANRHAQTGKLVAQAFRNKGVAWPEVLEMPEFDEYQAFELMRVALPGLLERDAALREVENEYRQAADAAAKARAFEKMFQHVTRLWVNGKLEANGVEPWADFCVRVSRALDRVRGMAGKNSNVVVFTSGGPISAAVRAALGLSPEKTLELSWASRNSSYSEFLFSGSRFSLSSFNALPHISDPGLLTYR